MVPLEHTPELRLCKSMRRLLIMRHAKSSWSDPDLEDSMRPLNERGRENAKAMAKLLLQWQTIPELVITSHARRCQETWDRMKAIVGASEAPVFVEDDLYSSGPDAMLRALKEAPDNAKTVLMIGHQPVMSSFARMLSNGTTKSGCARAFKRYPTGAIGLFEPKSDSWSGVSFGQNTFSRFACPRELVDA